MTTTGEDNNVSMQEDSPSSKTSSMEESKSKDQSDTVEEEQQDRHADNSEEEINFEELPFQIPPSFSRSITEETLRDDN